MTGRPPTRRSLRSVPARAAAADDLMHRLGFPPAAARVDWQRDPADAETNTEPKRGGGGTRERG